MGRSIRFTCDSDVYHVTTRGVAQQAIFEDDKDRQQMLELLGDSASKFNVKIYAWCFMSNHVHLLLQAPMVDISAFMNSVLSRYAKRYNERHDRKGHLFQERFYSNAIDSDEYLLTAVRYIHFNPLEMGVLNIAQYQWSSYRDYLGRSVLSDTEFVLGMFGGVQSFRDFHAIPNNDQVNYKSIFEGAQPQEAPSDDVLMSMAKELLDIDNLSAIAQADIETRNNMIATLKAHMSVRQIVRITGLGRNIIQRIKRVDE